MESGLGVLLANDFDEAEEVRLLRDPDDVIALPGS